MSRKLNQVIAIEKGVKSRVYGVVTELHKQSQKPEPFQGLSRVYRKRDEEGEDLPAEKKKVTLIADDVLNKVSEALTELFDIEASKDWANCRAVADVAVDGRTLLAKAPATYLLFLEKQIVDVRTFVEKLPTLDEAEEWTKDPNGPLFRTAVTSTHRTKKVQRPLVLFPATPEHPAQTQLVTEDVLVGYWDTTKFSGAIPVPQKVAILQRVDTLLKAVKEARERANEVEAPSQNVGEVIFGYLMGNR